MKASTEPWRPFNVALDPALRLSFDRLLFYETRSYCYAIGTDAQRTAYRVLRFSRSNCGILDYYVDKKVYTRSEIDSLILAFKREAGSRAVKARALLGCVRFTQWFYLVLATRRRRVARIGLHSIFEVTDFDLISLAQRDSGILPVLSMYPGGRLSTPFLTRRTVEDYYREQFLATTLKENFYYSHTYDLTNTLQVNTTVSYGDRKMRPKFVWNEFLMEPFVSPTPIESESPEGGTLLIPAGLGQWTVCLVHGCIVQSTIWCNTKPILLTLIGRVSKNFAGARYLRRGVSSDGHVANHVEVEQIVMDESTLHTHFTRGNFSSFVQVRGSVPLHWFHPPTQLPRPPLRLGGSDLYYMDTCKHFQELLEDYGAPLVIVNLLKQREKRPRESLLGREYRKAVAMINSLTKKSHGVGKNIQGSVHFNEAVSNAHDSVENNEESDIGNHEEILSYHEFDIREAAHDAWNNVTTLAEISLDKTGFFACNEDVIRRQVGVARSNCVDCIDRTNIAQFLFGLHALGHQLHTLNLLHSPVDIALSPGVQELLLDMYLLMGDAIAVQYGGSPQVGAGVLHRGTGWDKIMGIKRLFNNVVGDREKQSSLNIFLGRYQPYPNPNSTARNPIMCIPGGVIFRQGDVLQSFSLVSVAYESLLSTFTQRRHVGRVLDLSEVESDYYLQVKGAPSLSTPSALINWWRKPIQKFYETLCINRKEDPNRSPDVLAGKDEEATEEASAIRRFCLLERVSAMMPDNLDTEWGISGDTTNTNGASGMGDDTETVQLTMTNALTTLAKHPVEPPPTLLSDAQVEMDRGLLANRESNNEYVSYNGEPNSVISSALIHNHRTYPDEVRQSVFARDVKIFRHMCDDCEPSADISRMQLAVLAKYGDPAEWPAETVAEVLADVEPEVSAGTLNYIRQMNVDGYTLLYRLDADSMGQRVIISRFIELVQKLPRTSLDNARRCLDSLNESVMQYQKITEEGVDGERTAFPDATCRLIQPFFIEAVYPATMARTVRRLLREMIDERTGVPRCDRLRYCEKAHQRVPPAMVALQCFGAKEMHQWLLRESSRIGLTLHKYVEPMEASQAAWKFMIWLAHANIITRVIIEPTFGVVVRPAIKFVDFTSRSYLFTFSILQKARVLNMDIKNCIPNDGISLFQSRKSPCYDKDGFENTVVYAESLAGMAFGALTSVQEMTSNQSDASQDHVIRVLLNNISRFVTYLAESNITNLSSREKWCFWVNVFNVLYIHAWLEAPFHRVQDCANFYNSNCYYIGGYMFSLNDIKNGILRGNKPPFYALLPPFAAGDPRLLFLPEEYSGATNILLPEEESYRIKGRILLALIDAYLVPDNLENATVYNPRAFIDDTDQTTMENSVRTDDDLSAIATPENDSDDDTDPPQKNISAKRNGKDDDDDENGNMRSDKSMALRRAGSLQLGTASWFTSWLRHGRLHGNKGAAFLHPCVVLVPATLRAQLYAIEGQALRGLSAAATGGSAAMVTRNGVHVPRVAIPWLLHPGEFGATLEEILRALHQSHSAAAGKRQQVPSRLSK